MLSQDAQWLLKEKYNSEKTAGFFTDLERLEAGEPLAFVIGSIPFLNTTIYLDSHPLIPRVETEYWVSKVRETLAEGHTFTKVLDLCAGSGCIGVAVAKAFPKSTVHFAEIDARHHTTIQKNIEANAIQADTEIFGGHLFQNTRPPYDVILCNPPYIRNESEHVQESVKRYEPPIALYGGEDGTDLIREIITFLPRYLSEFGVLFIEHEPEQVPQITSYANAHGYTHTAHRDQYGVMRYSELRKTHTTLE